MPKAVGEYLLHLVHEMCPQKITLVTLQKQKDCPDKCTLKFPVPTIFYVQPPSKQAGALGNVAFPFGSW